MEEIKNELFERITAEDVSKMMKCFKAKEKTYKNKEIICTYNKSTNFIGIIMEGTADLVRIDINGTKTILETLNKDDIFGETIAFSNLIEDYIYIVATSDIKVLLIDNNQITKRCKNACECHSALVENLLKLITVKTVKLYERIQILSQRNIREKLMTFFLLQANKERSKEIVLKDTFTDLADYICTERTAMMRELRNMQNDNLITVNKKNITIM